MLFSPGERTLTHAQQRELIRELHESKTRALFVANDLAQPTIVGFAGITRLGPQRRAHIAQVVVGVLSGYRRRGIASRLLDELARWARASDLAKLELTVAVPNTPAVALYRAKGYQVEGTRKAALRIDPELVDEYYMALSLG